MAKLYKIQWEQMLKNDTGKFLFVQNHNDAHRNFITTTHF